MERKSTDSEGVFIQRQRLGKQAQSLKHAVQFHAFFFPLQHLRVVNSSKQQFPILYQGLASRICFPPFLNLGGGKKIENLTQNQNYIVFPSRK